jgi:ABC-type Na+ efflux pump permease subunit
MTVGLSLTLIALSGGGAGVRREVASIGNGFQAGVGLLLLSISAATALADERVRGQLDVLLTTPLSTRSIVWAKWWGAFQSVPLLAVAPAAVSVALARSSGRWEGAALVAGLFIAYGAAVTSLGLALATWVRRLDLAVALSASLLGVVTVGWLFTVLLVVPGPDIPELAAGSPIIGVTFPTIAMSLFKPGEWRNLVVAWTVWIGIYVAIAAGLGWATLLTFDRCLGRACSSTNPRPLGQHSIIVSAVSPRTS